jgi:thiol-disulfide isomerase/thioredoxin
MKKNRWILGLAILVIAIAILSYWGFKRDTSGKNQAGPQATSQTSASPIYYSDTATVMEFYQDTCEWCIKEQPVLEQLGAQGYRVKPMNIGANHPENQSWWQQYNISGTPTFIAKNGDRLEGYHDYNSLKAWLDQHK